MTRSGARVAGDVADEVVLGVDTHLDFHVAVALERLGRRLGKVNVPTTPQRATKGYCVGRRASAPCGA